MPSPVYEFFDDWYCDWHHATELPLAFTAAPSSQQADQWPLPWLPPDSHQAVWLKALGTLPDDPALHRAALAYASDYSILESIYRAHGIAWTHPLLLLKHGNTQTSTSTSTGT